MNSESPLAGQVAVITGATSGIGKSIALRLAAKKLNLVLIGRDLEDLERVGHVFGNAPNVSLFQLDLATDVEYRTEALLDMVGDVDLLVHSAGLLVANGSFEGLSEGALDLQYRVNVRSPFVLTKALLPGLTKRKGQVLFVNSSAARQKAKAGVIGYTATKYALMALADGFRDDVNASGIRVVSVFPGKTATPMQEQIYEAQNRPFDGSKMLQPQDVAQACIDALELPRTAEVTDIDIRPFLKD